MHPLDVGLLPERAAIVAQMDDLFLLPARNVPLRVSGHGGESPPKRFILV
jgi:hypothetical protein